MKIEVDYTIIIVLLLFSASVSCVLCVYIYTKSRSRQIMTYFILGQLLTILWTVLYVFELLAPTTQIRWRIVCIEYITLCYLGVVFFHFAYRYAKRASMRRSWYILSYIPPTIGYISVLTNKYHHLFYSAFGLHSESFGIMTYYIMVVTVLYLIAGVVVFFSKSNMEIGVRRKQSIYFLIAVLIPSSIHVLYLFGYLDFGFCVTLVFIPFSMLVFIVSILKYQFLDIIPMAINEIIDDMMDGILVVLSNGKIIDYNYIFFQEFFDINDMSQVKTIEEFEVLTKDRMISDSFLGDILFLENKISKNIHENIFRVENRSKQESIIYYTTKAIDDYSGKKVATLITFFDMTDIYHMYKSLEKKNVELMEANKHLNRHLENVQQLAVETERNRLMVDIHDTLTHSLMELLAILEKVDLVMEQGRDDVRESLEEALLKARRSLVEIRSAVSRYKQRGGQ